MKNTPLTEKHIALGARMAEFAGYNMPISYEGIKEEHFAVRQNVGIFDVSHMGEFYVSGENALALIQQVTSNNASKLNIGDAQYSCLPNKEGGIVDDLLVYRTAELEYMLVVNASNMDKDWDWISKENEAFGATLENRSDEICLLAVQGPNTNKALQSLTAVNLEEIGYYTFRIDEFAGVNDVVISATGYTGSGGFELYIPKENALEVWNAIMEAGKEIGIKPCGLGARDTLRLEMGYCLYGNDINDTTSPIEAGLSWITKVKKGDFNSQHIFQHQKKEGTPRRLVGFKMDDKRVPRNGYEIEDTQGNTLGYVTSGTSSPSLGYPIGLGYVEVSHRNEGSEIIIVMRNKRFPAKVTKLPFVQI